MSVVVAGVFQGGGTLATVTPALVAVVLLAVLRAPLSFAGDVLAQRASSLTRGRLRESLTAHVLALGPAWARSERTGELAGVVVDGMDDVDAYVHLLPAGPGAGRRGPAARPRRDLRDRPTDHPGPDP